MKKDDELIKLKKRQEKAISMLIEHINHCETEARSSLNNEKCQIALKFDKHLLRILDGTEEEEMKNLKQIKKTNLEWYVYNHDFNADKMIKYNVLNSGYIDHLLEIIGRFKKEKGYIDRNILKECVERWGHYNFWSKTECEFFAGGMFSDINTYEKICMWDQIEINLDRFIDYLDSKLDILSDDEN